MIHLLKESLFKYTVYYIIPAPNHKTPLNLIHLAREYVVIGQKRLKSGIFSEFLRRT
jgi:hypothetical protein